MVEDSESGVTFRSPDKYDRLANFMRWLDDRIRDYSEIIAKTTMVLGAIVAIGNAVIPGGIQIQLSDWVEVANSIVNSTATATTLIIVLLILQIDAQLRIRTLTAEASDRNRETCSEEELETDGGSSDLPPRDSQGRFKSRSSGAGFLMVVLGGLAGLIFGSQFSPSWALAGAFLGVAFGAFVFGRD